ncbi:MAG: hypothetical protein Q9217_006052 [Psora testacea]
MFSCSRRVSICTRILVRATSTPLAHNIFYDGHVPLTRIERGALAAGSALGAVVNPRRADLVAALGEVTAGPLIRSLRDTMLLDETGRRILRDRPRLTSKTMPVKELRTLPENTVGQVYAKWLEDYRMSPDGRDSVRYIDDEECAYVMQRYRECHDIYHAILGIPAFVEGEIALKAFEFANTRLPMAALSMFAVVRLKPEERNRFFATYLPWAVRNGLKSEPIINVYWEKELLTDVDALLTRLQIERPPDLRSIRRRERLRKKAEKESKGET